MIILKPLHISNHAKERYAERNMHATKLEVPMFVDKYDTKIQDDHFNGRIWRINLYRK